MSEARFELTASPRLKAPDSTARIMWTVSATLAPATLAAAWLFGAGVLLVVAAAILGAAATERLFEGAGTLSDGSAVLTGLLLGLTLPPGFPLWMSALGGAAAIGFGKAIFGGLGQNVFNPALLGRAFLQAAFPTAITTWAPVGPGGDAVRGDLFAFPFTTPEAADAVTGATPLGLMKFEGVATDAVPLLLGNTTGSLGETSAVLILAGGAYLAVKRYLDWRIPAAIFLTVALVSGALHAIDPGSPGPLFSLLSGGLVLGAVYMATDPVTSPVTKPGAWIFGIGIGLLVVLIRVWGGLPEGVMYAILFMNALVPFIGRATQPRVFGTAGEEGAA
ncbi:MAG: RnfABCDGE type electron transport complex subunit D [Gemmatimonadota bacterium]|nr:RnfABCDGE type electron transport complex subunit D [Gemmatimonadota bacterium]